MRLPRTTGRNGLPCNTVVMSVWHTCRQRCERWSPRGNETAGCISRWFETARRLWRCGTCYFSHARTNRIAHWSEDTRRRRRSPILDSLSTGNTKPVNTVDQALREVSPSRNRKLPPRSGGFAVSMRSARQAKRSVCMAAIGITESVNQQPVQAPAACLVRIQTNPELTPRRSVTSNAV